MAEFTDRPLTPLAFLDRAVRAFGQRTAIEDGDVVLTYEEFNDRVGRLVSALARGGVGPGDRVLALCANSHVMLELHYAVPARGCVLVPLNVRLSLAEMKYIVEHSGARLLVATHEFRDRALDLGASSETSVVVAGGDEDSYEEWIAVRGRADDVVVRDERDLIAINYTSGTTGRPKGVMYQHRGAYLQALAMAYHAQLYPGARYLWTLPMFHCNGWSFTWAVGAAGGTHVCLRRIDPEEIWRLLGQGGITHLSAAPTVLTMLSESSASTTLPHRVHVDTGGAPPSPALLERMDALGFDITHLYGLTETYGPIAINEWQPEWNDAPSAEQVRLRARQGVSNLVAPPLRVLDPAGNDVPGDGVSVGEVAVTGNVVMLGYYKDEAATRAATRSGCFVTGDLGVMHPDGYVELVDRAKDIIISGGENIASVEVERAIDAHRDVVESAVVAAPNERWGEVPVAFVVRRTGSSLTERELLEHLRDELAGFKLPRAIVFGELPKTATGKIQKNVLRKIVTDGTDNPGETTLR